MEKGESSNRLLLIQLSIILATIFLSFNVVADTTLSNPSNCCERTVEGAFCVNTDKSNCDNSFKTAPTSCEATAFCKLGTCYDSEEGICMENTPVNVCNENGGLWDEREINEVPQCQLGCCIIADQAAFVPLVRCKRLSTLFGVSNDYRTNINSEIACIAEAQSQDMGACVYEKDFERICEFTTRGDCGAGETVEQSNGTKLELSASKKFYKDMLCSAEELNTACAKQTKTMCYQGKVYWQDSCGNRENIYSNNKDLSWANGRIKEASEICDPNDGSNKNCGNCDYLLGSRCAEYEGFVGGPSEGDYYCQKTECKDRNGNDRRNGESWCVTDNFIGGAREEVGSRYYRELCVDGKVRVEPCADFRNEICIQDKIDTKAGDFSVAGCRVNRWQDCLFQTEEDDCTNIAKRDCLWSDTPRGLSVGGETSEGESETKGFSNPTKTTFNNPTATGNVVAPITGEAIFGGSDAEEEIAENKVEQNRKEGICLPNYAPGLEFWTDTGAANTCGQIYAKCVVVYEKSIGGSWKVVEGKECLKEDWAIQMNSICSAVGDCGGYTNYAGEFTHDGYEWIDDGKDEEFTPNTENKIAKGITGFVFSELN